MVDATEGMLGIEWVEGKCVRALLPGAETSEEEFLSSYRITPGQSGSKNNPAAASWYILFTDELMKSIGTEIAKMHQADIIHSDLTTSNLMLRRPESTSSPTELVCLSILLVQFLADQFRS
jgi:TP53 regulating kinase-like protein